MRDRYGADASDLVVLALSRNEFPSVRDGYTFLSRSDTGVAGAALTRCSERCGRKGPVEISFEIAVLALDEVVERGVVRPICNGRVVAGNPDVEVYADSVGDRGRLAPVDLVGKAG